MALEDTFYVDTDDYASSYAPRLFFNSTSTSVSVAYAVAIVMAITLAIASVLALVYFGLFSGLTGTENKFPAKTT